MRQYTHGLTFTSTEEAHELDTDTLDRVQRVIDFAEEQGLTLLGGTTASAMRTPAGTPIERKEWAGEKPWRDVEGERMLEGFAIAGGGGGSGSGVH